MKRLLATTISLISLLLMSTGLAHATTWEASISTLPAHVNTHSFNVQYTVLSIQADTFTIALMQSMNGESFTQCGSTVDTSSDPHDTNGGSGSLPACVSADGSYSFKFVVTRDGTGGSDVQQTATTSTNVDTVPPPPPIYGGKTQLGDTYTIHFTAPNSNDVATIDVFASTSKTYTADASTFIGQETGVSPNQSFNFGYTAPDSTTRYFSVQSFDAAGNGSTLVGDPGIVVHPTVFTNLNGNGVPNVAAAQAAAATPLPAGAGGQVQGATTNAPNNGQINAPGSSTSNKSQNKGKVLGASIITPNSHKGWYIGGGIILVLLITYWFARRGRWFKRGGGSTDV